ncbi:1-deoxy-D-xylulose-5-phosphate reductoisomerase [Candidatus Sumerlaeota bacterium]|nr:1-deoxy-D-xylulose-5-phosphate reductoisomerase [Candidatus Sumerlaeota bacterium]
MINIAILGSTGSIGRRALDVLRDLGPDHARVRALVANRSAERLADQVREFRPDFVGLVSEESATDWADQWPGGGAPDVSFGPACLEAAAELDSVDVVVVATVGSIGLRATLAAIARGRSIALANKEVLVCAGDIVMAEARRHGSRIMPIDSEHSAIFQCLWGNDPRAVRRLILTASGGPFRGATLEKIRGATREDALAHPTWSMGDKITIDSATMMNKGLELIEAHHLFDIPHERIDIVVHPESILHSMVEFLDGSVLAQLSTTDMYLPILNALTWPERIPNPVPPLDFAAIRSLTFEPPDPQRFPCLGLAHRSIAEGGTMPAVLNAANEVAVAGFLAGEIGLLDIPDLIGRAMKAHSLVAEPSLEEIFAADAWARREVEVLCSSRT